MEKLVPCMLHVVNTCRFPEIKWGRVIQYMDCPMQIGLDCGIFVCKYVDAYLMGLSFEKQRWSKEDVQNFRFCIAWELRKGEARHMPNYCFNWRLKFPSQIGESKKRKQRESKRKHGEAKKGNEENPKKGNMVKLRDASHSSWNSSLFRRVPDLA